MTTVTGADIRGSFSPASSFSQAWLECAHLIWLHLDGLCPSALGPRRDDKSTGMTTDNHKPYATRTSYRGPIAGNWCPLWPTGSRTTTIMIRGRDKASLGHGREGWRGRDD